MIAAATLLPAAGGAAGRAAEQRFEWRGTALGADARLVLFARDRRAAARAVAAALAEIERLEREFSLYRADSAVSRLNREGRLRRPSLDLLAVLAEARRCSEHTGGAFDITVQPLWRVFADHFAAAPADGRGPNAAAVQAALRRVGYRRVHASPAAVELEPGTEITLNGIAQGYITDRVADLLRDRGWRHVLVDLGELRAVGGRADGRPWEVMTAPPGGGAASAPLSLADRAIAVSAGAGTRFDHAARHHHLFSPATGTSARHYEAVAVTAGRAVTADALSTALYVAAPHAAPAILDRFPGVEARFVPAAADPA